MNLRGDRALPFVAFDLEGHIPRQPRQFLGGGIEPHRAVLVAGALSSDAAKAPIAVTILSEEQAEYSRTVNVLNALAAARIDNVAFALTEEE